MSAGPMPGMGAPGGMPGAQPGAPAPPPPIAPPQGIMPKPAPSLNPLPTQTYTDLPSELPPPIQLLDGAVRQMKLCLKLPETTKDSKLYAYISDLVKKGTNLISHYSKSGDAGGAPTSVSPFQEDSGDTGDAHYTSVDASDAPPPESES